MKKLTTDEFIRKAKEIHGDKYDYSKVEYVNNRTPVIIICPKHGEFKQTPDCHLSGRGCKECGIISRGIKHRNTTERFIIKAKAIHNGKYDYSNIEYINRVTQVRIICPIHGEFLQRPNDHLSGCGCPKCGNESMHNKQRKTIEQFISQAKEVHGNKYDYSKVEYINSHTEVCIICPKHGEFLQKPNEHLRGKGCKKCYGNEKMTTEEFIKKARKIHGDKYDYSKVNYVNNRTKVCIICPIHGEFWQKPNVHLRNHGCPTCKSSKLETEIKDFLQEYHINFDYQKHFTWLGRKTLDFYLPQYNIAIECQGKQHFGLGGWIKDNNFEEINNRDRRKRILCEENDVKLLYYSNLEIDYPYEVITDKNKLLEIIESYAKQKLDKPSICD